MESFNIQDSEIKDILRLNIISSKYSQDFDGLIDKIIEINKHIIKYLREWSRHLGQIISYSIYPSSADEDEREMIDDDFRDVKMQLRDKISDVARKLLPLLRIRDKIKNVYDKITSILHTDKTSVLHKFINSIDVDWIEEFDKADMHRSNTIYHIDTKIDDVQKYAYMYGEEAKIYFPQAMSATLVLSTSKDHSLIDDKFKSSVSTINHLQEKYRTMHVDVRKKQTRKSKK